MQHQTIRGFVDPGNPLSNQASWKSRVYCSTHGTEYEGDSSLFDNDVAKLQHSSLAFRLHASFDDCKAVVLERGACHEVVDDDAEFSDSSKPTQSRKTRFQRWSFPAFLLPSNSFVKKPEPPSCSMPKVQALNCRLSRSLIAEWIACVDETPYGLVLHFKNWPIKSSVLCTLTKIWRKQF